MLSNKRLSLHTVNMQPLSDCLSLCALQRKSFVNRQHLAFSATGLLTCVCNRGML